MQAHDPLTGQPFVKNRLTQRFASRSNQIRYNNQRVTERKRELAPYLKALYRNRQVLDRVMQGKVEITVTKDFLAGAGYDFVYQTHTGQRNSESVIGLFEFGLIPKPGNRYLVYRLRLRPGMKVENPDPIKP
jgi:hypothetical protein